MTSKSSAAIAMRELRRKLKENGQCIYCENPLETTTMCNFHAVALREYKDAPKRESGPRYLLKRRSKLNHNVMVRSSKR